MENLFEESLGFHWGKGNIGKKLIKHNVEDWECEQIFLNEPLLIQKDLRHSVIEKRFAAFGRTDAGRLLVIIFTIRKKLIRIISARDTNRKERKFYEENQ